MSHAHAHAHAGWTNLTFHDVVTMIVAVFVLVAAMIVVAVAVRG
jgi:hypothetical protein